MTALRRRSDEGQLASGVIIAGLAGIAVVALLLMAATDSGPFANDNGPITSRPTAGGQPGGTTTDNPPCQLDKVGTWSEGNNPHRIEVGGHGGQHLDYYPMPGVKSVSYIVDSIPNPDGVPSIVWGYGSLWEGDKPECVHYDWVKDATNYARARLDSGHSGLVVHNGEVVANVGNLSQQEVDMLANKFTQASGQPGTQSGTAAQATNCKDAVREDHDPVVGQTWTPRGEYRVVNFWTNEPDYPQGERKLLLMPGENPALFGGGASFSWPAACEQAVRAEFDKNSNSPVTLDQLHSEGLVQQ